jgi:hypothetical protein
MSVMSHCHQKIGWSVSKKGLPKWHHSGKVEPYGNAIVAGKHHRLCLNTPGNGLIELGLAWERNLGSFSLLMLCWIVGQLFHKVACAEALY